MPALVAQTQVCCKNYHFLSQTNLGFAKVYYFQQAAAQAKH